MHFAGVQTSLFEDNQRAPIVTNERPQAELLKTVQDRAFSTLDRNLRTMAGKSENVFVDPYGSYSPDDSALWLKLFTMAGDNELVAMLSFLRGVGTKLVPDKRWGHVIAPVIGADGWVSRDEYDREKVCLNAYRGRVVELLKELW